MALLKMGAIVTQISGKVGGQTFGKGKYGQYLKNTGSYINAKTPKRTGINSLLATVTSFWRTLTNAERDLWDVATANFPYTNRLGLVVTYSGFNLFTKFNVNRLLVKQTILLVPPSPTTVSQPTSFTMVPTINTFVIQGDPTNINVEYLVFCTPPLSAGLSKNESQLRLVKFIPYLDLSNGTSIFSAYVNIFGAPIQGQKIFLEIKAINKPTGIAAIPNLLSNAIVL